MFWSLFSGWISISNPLGLSRRFTVKSTVTLGWSGSNSSIPLRVKGCFFSMAFLSSGIRFSVPSMRSLNGFPQALVFEVCINSSDAVLIILIFSFESSTTIPVIKLSNTCAYLLIFSCGSVKVFVLQGFLINKHLFFSFFNGS